MEILRTGLIFREDVELAGRLRLIRENIFERILRRE
jgi:hypothetical protein